MSFRAIGARRDLSDAAKRLHAALVSMVRQGLHWTQAELAEHLGWSSRQKVWRATTELLAAGLVRMRRLGLGRPNSYELVSTDEISREDLAGRAPRLEASRAGHQQDRPRTAPARARQFPQIRTRKEPGYTSIAAVDAARYTTGPLSGVYVRT